MSISKLSWRWRVVGALLWPTFDYIVIARSGLFMKEDYARLYCGSGLAKRFPLLHYIMSGERFGFFPNPFFDPNYLSKQSGTRSLARYLTEARYRRFPSSPLFDPDLYIAQSGYQGKDHPLIHFWNVGFDRGVSASNLFDTRFFHKAIARDRPDKKRFAFELVTGEHTNIVWNSDMLRERRTAFQDQIRLHILRSIDKPKNRNLLFVQCSGAFDVTPYLEHCFDTMLNFYIEPSNKHECKANYELVQKGTKTTAIDQIMRTNPDFFLRYDHVFFLDDDIVISAVSIEHLFKIIEDNGLDLAQPSLTAQSAYFFPDLKQPLAGSGVTRLSAVEIMMPVLSRRALVACGWVFHEGISGWAVDLLLSAEVRKQFGETIALIGDIVAEHERPTDATDGGFYKFLAQYGIDATTEAGNLALVYGIDDSSNAIRHID